MIIKKVLFLLMLSLFAVRGKAQDLSPTMLGERIRFYVMYQGNPTPIGGYTPTPRGPEEPEMSIDGHTLFIRDLSFNAELVLFDAEGEEILTTLITVGTPSVTLPSTLSGEYQLQLIPTGGNIYFYGYVLF